MTKKRSGKKRKAEPGHGFIQQQQAKRLKPAIPGQPLIEASNDLIGGLLCADELETTTETLTLLSQNPDLIALKPLKAFRTALHDCLRASSSTSGAGGSTSARISSALTDGRYTDSKVLLAELRIRKIVPKLGSLQRWVRELDAVLRPGMSDAEESEIWAVLDALLRTTQPQLVFVTPPSPLDEHGVRQEGSRLERFKPFVIPSNSLLASNDWEDPNQLEGIIKNAVNVMQVLEVTPGAERRPPNKHPAIIYFSPSRTFPLSAAVQRTEQPKRTNVPGVPGAFVISDIFSPAECQALVRVAEGVGLQPDEPISGSAVQLSSVLAHNLIWLADEAFLKELFQRLKDFLPAEWPIPTDSDKIANEGGQVRGINARFRLYRYRPGALYRPHIDGAWPSSALNTSTSPPSYIYDSDPLLYSRLTLLIYLNSNFQGGHTTFFLPSQSQEGIMCARPVQPLQGSVCVFPHGSAEGSLLHEGSGVEAGGVKYIIRTEVLYEVGSAGRGGNDVVARPVSGAS